MIFIIHKIFAKYVVYMIYTIYISKYIKGSIRLNELIDYLCTKPFVVHGI